jgi:polynucleotide 5'-hydroxyl-kinase GRC3/NOL9
MLSAIAARKAAQAANGIGNQKPEPDPPAVEAAPLPTEVTTQSRPTSKRKTGSQGPNSSRKRKKKREAELKKSRYFDVGSDPFQNSDGIIVIDSDDSEDEDVSDTPPAPLTRTKVVGKRAWSPSAPINDSSDDDGDEILDVPVLPAPRVPTQSLTTLRVVPDETVFYLQSEETALLGLKVDAATVLLLATGQTSSFLGAYAFTVLQGAISICGGRVEASATAHRVFAPRSSPIPVIEALDGGKSYLSVVSSRLKPAFQSGGTLVALYQLQSGVEGLGKICRIFDGVFWPSRWQQPTDDLRLPGVHLVIIHPLLQLSLTHFL